MKGTLPGAALPPCRRPQHCSQSRERPPPGAGLSPGLSPQDQPQGATPAATRGNRQDDHRKSPRSARPQRRSGTLKRRRTRPQRIKAGRDRRTTAERAHRLDFGLSRYVRRGYPRGGTHRSQAADTKTTSGKTPGEPAADGNFDPGSGTR